MILWKHCTQYASKFGKLSSGHRSGKGQFSFQPPKKAMLKDVQTTAQLQSSHTLAWRTQWHPTPVLLPGKSHGRRSLVGCNPWGHWESDTTEWLHFHFSLSCIGEGNGNPLQCSCLENPKDRGAWWAAVYGVAQSQTLLKWLNRGLEYSAWESSLSFPSSLFLFFSFPVFSNCFSLYGDLFGR